MRNNLLAFLLVTIVFTTYSQNKGPGGVGNNDGSDMYLWLKTDDLTNGSLATWVDDSGSNNNLSQFSPDAQPTIIENSWNGYPIVYFDGGQDFINTTVSGLSAVPEYSIITAWQDLETEATTYSSIFASSTTGSGTFQIGYNNEDTDGSTPGADNFSVRSGGNEPIDDEANLFQDIRQRNVLYVQRTGDIAGGVLSEVMTSVLREKSTVTKTLGNNSIQATNFQEFKIGVNRGNGVKNEFNMTEFVIFKSALNNAQRIIVANYLATKYNFSNENNNVYEGGALGFHYDVAGVGQESTGNQHLSAQGTGIVSVTLPGGGSLGDNEYLMWGHDNVDVTTATTLSVTPEFGETTTVVNKLDRTWYMSETSAGVTPVATDLGVGTVTFDLSDLSHSISVEDNIRLLVDNDNTFGLGTTSYAGTISGNIATFTNVDFNNGYYFTLASVSPSETIGIVSGSGMGGYQGPGGVGTNNGSDMYLWLRADLSSSITTATGVSQWGDQSGNTNNLVQATGTNQPELAATVMNGLPVVRFDGENNTHSLALDITDDINDDSYSIMYVWNFTKSTTAAANESLFSSSNSSATTDSFQNGFAGTTPSTRWQVQSHQMVQEADFSSATIGIDTPNIIEYSRSNDESSNSYSNNTNTLSKTLSTNTENSVFTHFKLGQNRNSGAQYIDADLAEFMIFSNDVNSLERTLISNYLSAKYGINLNESDIYDGDDDGYDFDVAGVGNDGTDTHLDSRGTGIVRVNTLSDLGTDEYLIWGANKDNNTQHTFSTVSTGGETDFSRLNTVWKVSESSAGGASADVGSFNISFDLSNVDFGTLDIENCLDLKLVIDEDADDDKIFSTATHTVDLVIADGFATATVTGVQIEDNDLFTLQYQDAIVRELDGTAVWRNNNNGDTAPTTTDECYKLIIKDSQEVELTSNFNVSSLEVQDGSKLIIASGVEVTVQNGINLNTSGELKLLGSAQLVQVNDATNLNSGTNFYNTITPPTKNKFLYSYFGSPVDNGAGEYTVSGVLRDARLTPLTAADNGDALTFTSGVDDGEQAGGGTTIAEDWIYTYVNGGVTTADDGEIIENGFDLTKSTGSIKVSEGYTMKYPGSESQPFIFKGRPNNGTYVTTLGRNLTSLVSNPYPSPIDANQFIADNSTAISGSLYFLEHQAAADHDQANYELGYAVYTTDLGVVASATEDGLTAGLGSHTYTAPDRYIPVGQGFFVYSDKNGGDLVFNNTQRVFKALVEDTSTDGVDGSVFFKTKKLKTLESNPFSSIHIGFEFQLAEGKVYHRSIAAGFKAGNALKQKDFGYDALMFDLKPSDAYFGVETETLNEDDTVELQDEKFVILGTEQFNQNSELPVYVELDQDREVFFMIDNSKGIDTTVYLTDKVEGTQSVLTGNVVSKNLSSGAHTDRFYITFKEDQTLSSTVVDEKDFIVNQTDETIKVSSEIYNIQNVTLFNISGMQISSGETTISNISTLSNGLYILKIKTEKGSLSIKLAI